MTASAADEYRKLINALSSRAARLGSRDSEAAAHEAIRRSLVNSCSRAAIEYYFRDGADERTVPEWTLLQLFGWLHGVLKFVVREERARAGAQRETAAPEDVTQVPDVVPSQLDHAIDRQIHDMVEDCLSTLTADYRSTLQLRLGGAKYAEIAAQLGVNEKTVATWVRRGSIELVRLVKERLDRRQRRLAVVEGRRA